MVLRGVKDGDTLLDSYGFKGYPKSIAFVCLLRRGVMNYKAMILRGDDNGSEDWKNGNIDQ